MGLDFIGTFLEPTHLQSLEQPFPCDGVGPLPSAPSERATLDSIALNALGERGEAESHLIPRFRLVPFTALSWPPHLPTSLMKALLVPLGHNVTMRPQ